MDTLFGLTFFVSFYVFTLAALGLARVSELIAYTIAGIALLISVMCGWFVFLPRALRASDETELAEMHRQLLALSFIVIGCAVFVALPVHLALPSAGYVQPRGTADMMTAIIAAVQFFVQAHLVAKMRAYEIVACSATAKQ